MRAGGGVVVRDAPGGGLEVIVVHRPRYDDWSLPKGKLQPGEDWRAGALREVAEETGLECRIEAELEEVRYRDRKGRPKRVRYWLMRPAGPDDLASFVANDEVDRVLWVRLAEAPALLTYERDRALVASVAPSLQ